MTIQVELSTKAEAGIVTAASALGITPGQYSGAFIKWYFKASDSGHMDPGNEALRSLHEEFSKP